MKAASLPLPISICTIAHNEEQTLLGCLESVWGRAAQIVVLDAGSTDATATVIKTAQVDHPEITFLVAENDIRFNINKMKTFAAATQPWLFYLDADERFTDSLWQELAVVIEDAQYNGYLVGRRNFWFGHWLRWGGMYPERQPRLFRAGQGSFPLTRVHELLEIKGRVGELREPFLHYSYATVSQFINKLNLYTTFQAQIWAKQGVCWSLRNHLVFGFGRPFARFLQKYVIQLGLFDGFLGFFAAWMAGLTEFIAYIKVHDER